MGMQASRRVFSRRLDWDLSHADVLRMVRDDAHPVALLGAWAGGADIVASNPVRVCQQLRSEDCDEVDGDAAGASFGGGWIGYLGFDAAGYMMPAPPSPGGPPQLPASWFGYYDHVLRRDRASGRWSLEALVTPERAASLECRLGELSRRSQLPRPKPRAYSCSAFRLTSTPEEHKAAVRQTVDSIRRGDLFQANICLRLEAEFRGDPLDAFCCAASRLDPPYAAFLRLDDGAVASLSPELFLRRTGASVLSQPIKGTTARSGDEITARRQREALERSAKDRAENVMIVDLMRNDLSRVCVPGTVSVPALLRAEAHPGVWHLVSEVRGLLCPVTDDEQLIRATFPPGSVTGAPKVRALEIIHELETTPREVYTGVIGYRSPVAGLELNVAIRTFEFHRGRVWLGSGGGITANSDVDAEYRECLVKARPLIQALGASVSDAVVSSPPRPRPALGVFTSLRVTDGRGHDLDAHIARLAASTKALFAKPLPASFPADLAAFLDRRPSGRLRISARPVGGPLQVVIEIVPGGDTPAAVALQPVLIPGGLGAHKWRDRAVLQQAREQLGLGPDEQLLVLDANDDVLETDRANVFAVLEGILHTPPADGRLLPGVTRTAVLHLAAEEGIPAREAPLSARRLTSASEVFVTNSVHGIVPVTSMATTMASTCRTGTDSVWPTGPVSLRLQAALARRAAHLRLPALDRQAGPHVSLRRGRKPVIVLIDNYDSFTYNLAHMLLGNGCQVEVIRNDEVTAQDVAAVCPDGIVISPGPGTPAEAGISIEVVRACTASTPLLGICLGHQAIAAAFGAAIIAAPEPVHGRSSTVRHDGQGVLAGVPQHFRAARYHSLIVEESTLPPSLRITARSSAGIPMGLRHEHLRAEGLQFHPESVLTGVGSIIIGNFIRAVRKQSVIMEAP